jgi:uncharacterized protein (TIGR02687 family)
MIKLQKNLSKLFEKHRIILWYDSESNFQSEFQELSISGVEKVIVDQNEFALKHQLLLSQPKQKFLVYRASDRPQNDENWLLDIELSNHVFETDQAGLTLQELELPYSYRNWVLKHIKYFENKKRLAAFSKKLSQGLTEEELSYLLLQTVLKTNSGLLDDILRKATELFMQNGWDSTLEELQCYGLESFLWESLEANFNYAATSPALYDFILELFKRSFSPLSGRSRLNSGAEVLMAKWQDARSFEPTFIKLSSKVEKDLSIAQVIDQHELEELLSEELFESVEQQIIRILVSELSQEKPSWKRIEKTLKARETSYWSEHKYSNFYKAIFYGSELLQFIQDHQEIKFETFESGLDYYTTDGFKADQYYRLFIEHYRSAKQNNVLVDLFDTVHKAYSNSWLLRQADQWQAVIDQEKGWYTGGKSQRYFFRNWVKQEFLDHDRKLFVVISDALRFENGEELHQRFYNEIRFTSQLDYQVAGLPSYTQLGMASLLPHKELAFGEGDLVLADGKSTSGSGARKKILEQHSGVRATVLGAEEMMKLKSKGQEAKDLVQGHDLIYIYHNRIDKVGDDKTSEDKVIEAAREEIDFLVDLAKKISNMNGTHILFTSDHGYIYQHETLDQSDFTDAQIDGETVKENRRFVIGKGLKYNHNVIKFQAKQLRINNDLEILIPKGINRLRKQGAGSRFIHGGASLQEVVVPIVWASKKKADTVEKVSVEVLNTGNNRITTNIHTVRFYQTEAVGNGIIPRQIKAYFALEYQDEFKPLSDLFNYRFDSESIKAEEREVVNKFTLSTSLQNSQSVYLVLEERVEGTNQWITLNKYPYSLTLAMENDFDDF